MRSKESIPAPTDWQRKGAVDRDAIGVDDGDVAATGTAALDLSERHPDLIVVDLGIPDMDGIDLNTRLRASLTTPILVASARDARTAKVAALGAGARRLHRQAVRRRPAHEQGSCHPPQAGAADRRTIAVLGLCCQRRWSRSRHRRPTPWPSPGR
jgi:chemotaxis response regulator CheB